MPRTLRAIAIAAVLASLAYAGDARADRKVYLNGLDLTGVEVPARAFDAAKVRFDADGNVHITVPGYEVKAKSVEEPPAAAVTRRYFVAHTGTASGRVQYRITVYVNGTPVKTIRPGERDGVVEVTRFARAGDNRLHLVAKKDLGKERKRRSYSPADEVEIVLGQGTLVDGAVKLGKPLVRYSRNASESKDFNDAFRFEAR